MQRREGLRVHGREAVANGLRSRHANTHGAKYAALTLRGLRGHASIGEASDLLTFGRSLVRSAEDGGVRSSTELTAGLDTPYPGVNIDDDRVRDTRAGDVRRFGDLREAEGLRAMRGSGSWPVGQTAHAVLSVRISS